MMDHYLVRYGAMRSVATFKYDGSRLIRGDAVILRTDRGLEEGRVVDKITLDEEGAKGSKPGTLLRKVSADDRKRIKNIEEELSRAELRFARQKAAESGIEMKVVYVEHLFGGEKIIFYFLANGRVDFRKLVRELARNYQTRIELKQIGVRDEARLLADYEHCGQELCCRTWIKRLQPVTMKFAKNQKATLDPSKISGGCGRLMCCLRYEDKTYEELRKRLPSRKSVVYTKMGDGLVVDSDILSQTVVIQDEAGRRVLVPVDDIEGRGTRPAKETEEAVAPPETKSAGDAGRSGRGRDGGAPRRSGRSPSGAPRGGEKSDAPPARPAGEGAGGPEGSEKKTEGGPARPGGSKRRDRSRRSRGRSGGKPQDRGQPGKDASGG